MATVLVSMVALAVLRADTRTYADWSRFHPGNFDPEHTFSFEAGDIRVVVGDEYAHGGTDRPSYTGLHHLSHKDRAASVFCPLYAGVIGLRRACHIAPLGENGAILSVGEGTARVAEEYVVKTPHYIDHTARFTAGGTTGTWNNTSYMNAPTDPGIFLVQPDGTWIRHYSETHGDRASAAPATMDPLPTPPKVADAKYAHGTNGFWDGFSDTRFDPKYPLFYGRFDDLVLVFMIERRWGQDLIPYTSPTGGGTSQEFQRSNPAWDYRYRLRNLTPGAEVVIRSRIIYKRFVSNDDILQEYDRWMIQLSARTE